MALASTDYTHGEESGHPLIGRLVRIREERCGRVSRVVSTRYGPMVELDGDEPGTGWALWCVHDIHYTLMHDRELPSGMTTGELAKMTYPGATYDHALPQEWVNEVQAAGFDPRGRVVWLYEPGPHGRPAPLTIEARDWLNEHFDTFGWGIK